MPPNGKVPDEPKIERTGRVRETITVSKHKREVREKGGKWEVKTLNLVMHPTGYEELDVQKIHMQGDANEPFFGNEPLYASKPEDQEKLVKAASSK